MSNGNGNGTALELTQPERKERLIVRDDGPTAYLFDTARFEHTYRIAACMARASLIPDHLRGKKPEEAASNCLLIVNQAIRWGLDPFAVAPETYVVNGKLGFQGKLVAAVVNARAGLKGRLRYEFCGEGENRTITVIGQFTDESEPREVSLSVKQARTDNEMWKKDPDQKLVYSGVTKWARRHCPEIMLGVVTDDDFERMEETRQNQTMLADLSAKISGSRKPTQAEQADLPFNPPTPEEVASVESAESQPHDGPSEEEMVLADWYGEIERLDSISGVNSLEATATNSSLSEAGKVKIATACEVRRNAIRGSRGGKGKKDGLFDRDASATEAGI